MYLEVSHKEMYSVVPTGVLLNGRVGAGKKGFHLVRVPCVDSLQQLGEPFQTQDWHRLSLVGERGKGEGVKKEGGGEYK